MALAQLGSWENRVSSSQNIVRQISREAAVYRIFVGEPVIEAEGQNVGNELVAGIGVDPLKVVDQTPGRTEIRQGQIVVLHFQRNRVQPAGRDHIVRESRARGWVDDRDRLSEAE